MWCSWLFQRYAPALVDAYVLVALPVAFLVTCAIGMALERLVIRHLYGRPFRNPTGNVGHEFGVNAGSTGDVRQNVEVANPSWMAGGWVISPALTLPFNRLVIIAFVGARVVTDVVDAQPHPLGLVCPRSDPKPPHGRLCWCANRARG